MYLHLLDFVALALAAGAVVNAWLHEGGLFEQWRDALFVWGEYSPAEPRPATRRERAKELFAQLVNCRVCLTYHAAFWLFVLFLLPAFWLTPPWPLIAKAPIYVLAATRISLLIGLYVETWGLENDPEND
jgi:hypothetical protein